MAPSGRVNRSMESVNIQVSAPKEYGLGRPRKLDAPSEHTVPFPVSTATGASPITFPTMLRLVPCDQALIQGSLECLIGAQNSPFSRRYINPPYSSMRARKRYG